MEHCEQLKSKNGRSKGESRRLFANFSILFCAAALHSCSHSRTPQNAGEETAVSDGEATSGRAEPDATSHEEPAASAKDSPSAEKSDGAPATQAPISRVLPESFDCSGFTCYQFSQSREALVPLILHHKAQLIAFGEAHAPASFRGQTTVHRFTVDLLPTISDGASHLLLELLNPPKEGCPEEKAAAKEESDKITEGQSKQNQNEYLTLGTESRKLGVVPDILWSSCEDLAFIASPEGGVMAMMETIAKLSEKTLKEQLRSTRKGRPLVLAYGGALHNDATPRERRESWSYGPAMIHDVKGRYLEIDLIVPELISDSESWRSFTWYDAYKALHHRDGAILMKWGENSYSLFLEPGR